jgi:hypothetical protein
VRDLLNGRVRAGDLVNGHGGRRGAAEANHRERRSRENDQPKSHTSHDLSSNVAGRAQSRTQNCYQTTKKCAIHTFLLLDLNHDTGEPVNEVFSVTGKTADGQ